MSTPCEHPGNEENLENKHRWSYIRDRSHGEKTNKVTVTLLYTWLRRGKGDNSIEQDQELSGLKTTKGRKRLQMRGNSWADT